MYARLRSRWRLYSIVAMKRPHQWLASVDLRDMYEWSPHTTSSSDPAGREPVTNSVYYRLACHRPTESSWRLAPLIARLILLRVQLYAYLDDFLIVGDWGRRSSGPHPPWIRSEPVEVWTIPHTSVYRGKVSYGPGQTIRTADLDRGIDILLQILLHSKSVQTSTIPVEPETAMDSHDLFQQKIWSARCSGSHTGTACPRECPLHFPTQPSLSLWMPAGKCGAATVYSARVRHSTIQWPLDSGQTSAPHQCFRAQGSLPGPTSSGTCIIRTTSAKQSWSSPRIRPQCRI